MRSLHLFRLQETDERPRGGLQLPHKGSRVAGAELFSLGMATKLKGTA